MWKWIKSFFKKPEPPKSPEDRFWDAVEEFNAAWKAYEATAPRNGRMRPWMDWPNRRVIMSVSDFKPIERELSK